MATCRAPCDGINSWLKFKPTDKRFRENDRKTHTQIAKPKPTSGSLKVKSLDESLAVRGEKREKKEFVSESRYQFYVFLHGIAWCCCCCRHWRHCVDGTSILHLLVLFFFCHTCWRQSARRRLGILRVGHWLQGVVGTN